jgi:hypothetical protein
MIVEGVGEGLHLFLFRSENFISGIPQARQNITDLV